MGTRRMIKRRFKQVLFPIDMEIAFCEIKDLRKKWRDGILEDEMEDALAVTSYSSSVCFLNMSLWFNTEQKISEGTVVHECTHALMNYLHTAHVDTKESRETASLAMEWFYSCAMKTYRDYLKSLDDNTTPKADHK